MGTLRRLGRSLSRDREGAAPAAPSQEQEFGSSSDIAPPTQGGDTPKFCIFFKGTVTSDLKSKSNIVYASSWGKKFDPEGIERFIEGHAFLRSYDLAPRPPPPRTPPLSWTGDTQEY